MAFEQWRDHWEQRNKESAASVAAGQVLITSKRTRCRVSAPINPAFIAGANELGGRWRPKTKVWTFSIRSIRLVIELCVEVYGEGAITVRKE